MLTRINRPRASCGYHERKDNETLSRRLVREAVFKALFQVDMGQARPGTALDYSLQDYKFNDGETELAGELFRKVLNNQQDIDEKISQHLVNWDMERIASVDRSLLRLAAAEMLFFPDIPPAVSVNEALDLTRKYSEESSVSFVNAVLDNIMSDSSGKT